MVRKSVRSATHKRSCAVAVKSRFTRSGRLSGPAPASVVRGPFVREMPRRPAAFISRCTVQRATGRACTPPSRPRRAWTLRTEVDPGVVEVRVAVLRLDLAVWQARGVTHPSQGGGPPTIVSVPQQGAAGNGQRAGWPSVPDRAGRGPRTPDTVG